MLPINLAFVYPAWHINTANILWWLPLIAAIALTAILFWQRNSRWARPLFFAWIFFCVALLPVMGFIDTTYMRNSLVADHYQHIALLAVVTLVAAAVATAWKSFRGAPRNAVLAIATIAVALLIYSSYRQSSLYASPLALYNDTLEKNPACLIAHDNIAIALAASGKTDEAIQHSQAAIRINPYDSKALNNLGLIYTNQNRLSEAREQLEAAIHTNPADAVAQCNLGNVYVKLGQLPDAIRQYRESVRLRPTTSRPGTIWQPRMPIPVAAPMQFQPAKQPLHWQIPSAAPLWPAASKSE